MKTRATWQGLMVLAVLTAGLLASNQAFGRTVVGGKIAIDATWSVENSPYVLSGDVEVAPGAVVTIERNVTVTLMPGSHLRIAGRLDAERVFFNGALAADDQESLAYLPGAAGRLTRCAFLDLGLVFESSRIALTDGLVSNRNGTGVAVAGGVFPHIANTSFHDNSYFAVYRHGPEPLEVIDCYWGADNGPSGQGDGDGDQVSANVRFRPFSTAEPLDFLVLATTGVETGGDAADRRLQLTYGIYNLNGTDHTAVLGASLRGAGGRAVHHPESDIRAVIPPGFHVFTRLFKLPPGLDDGRYDLHWGVMGSGMHAYHAYVKQPDVVDIRNGRFDLAQPRPATIDADG
jgi:hypothetical protein